MEQQVNNDALTGSFHLNILQLKETKFIIYNFYIVLTEIFIEQIHNWLLSSPTISIDSSSSLHVCIQQCDRTALGLLSIVPTHERPLGLSNGVML